MAADLWRGEESPQSIEVEPVRVTGDLCDGADNVCAAVLVGLAVEADVGGVERAEAVDEVVVVSWVCCISLQGAPLCLALCCARREVECRGRGRGRGRG